MLWPVMSPGGNMLTRSFPLIEKEGDRVDHPHHVGIWLNYGDVNGLDFWNNSEARSPETRDRYGTIYHKAIEKTKSGKGTGLLETSAEWQAPDQTKMLEEQTSHWLKDLEQQAQRFCQHRPAISQRFGEQRTRHWEFQLASQATAARWGQLRRYELLLGNTRCSWPACRPNLDPAIEDLPWDIIDRIPGLARDM